VELEILASSTLFCAGESLSLLIQGHNIYEANRVQLMMGHLTWHRKCRPMRPPLFQPQWSPRRQL